MAQDKQEDLILICVVHLKAKKDFEKRADELYQLSEYVQKYNIDRTFIMGDFNEEQDDIVEFLTSPLSISNAYKYYTFQKFAEKENIDLKPFENDYLTEDRAKGYNAMDPAKLTQFFQKIILTLKNDEIK